jgi:NarL family two-component system response regulator YdfI
MIDVLVEASSPEAYAQIADLLRDSAQLRLVGSGPEAMPSDEGELRPDVVVPDVVVEVFEAVDSARDSAESFPWNTGGWNAASVPIILLVENPAQRLAEPLPPGVRAVLPRNITAAEIVGAIEAVAAGLYVFHPSDVDSVAALRAREAEHSPAPLPELGEPLAEPLVEPLTPREIEVLQLLSHGLGNKEIASRLNISEHTAKFHVASIMGKLGAGSRTEAVTLGIRHGLVLI